MRPIYLIPHPHTSKGDIYQKYKYLINFYEKKSVINSACDNHDTYGIL